MFMNLFSMQAWPLLNQLWENQITASNGSPLVYESIGNHLNATGEILLNHCDCALIFTVFIMMSCLGMYAASSKQFFTGASRAFDLAKYKTSMDLIIKGEAVLGLLKEELDSTKSLGQHDAKHVDMLRNSHT